MTALVKSGDPDPVYILRSGPQSVSSLTFAFIQENEKKEEVLVSGSQDGVIQIWNLKSKRVRYKILVENSTGILYADIVNFDGNDFVVTHSRNGVVQFWARSCINSEWAVQQSLIVFEYGYCPIALHEFEKEHWLAYPSSGESEFSVAALNNTMCFKMNPFKFKCDEKRGIVMHIRLFFKNEKLYGLVGYEDGAVSIWDIESRILISSIKLHEDPVMCLSMDDRASRFISGSANNKLYVVRVDENMMLSEHLSHDSSTSGFACASIRSDGCLVVCGGWDGKVRVFGWKKFKPLAILKFHLQTANIVCFSKDNVIAVASKDGRITIWDVYKDS